MAASPLITNLISPPTSIEALPEESTGSISDVEEKLLTLTAESHSMLVKGTHLSNELEMINSRAAVVLAEWELYQNEAEVATFSFDFAEESNIP